MGVMQTDITTDTVTDMTKADLLSAVRVLWAKSPGAYGKADDSCDTWLSLQNHLSDSAEVAKLIWDEWLAPGVKQAIGQNIPSCRALYIFLAAVHDVGKATPAFQMKVNYFRESVENHFPLRNDMTKENRVPHSLAGHYILHKYLSTHGTGSELEERSARRNAAKNAETYAVILGGHHGRLPETKKILEINHRSRDDDMGFAIGSTPCTEWENAQTWFVEHAAGLAGLTTDEIKALAETPLSVAAQSMLSGLVIMADWIASSFELVQVTNFGRVDSQERAEEAWDGLDIPSYWNAYKNELPAEEFYFKRFDFPADCTLRPVQKAVFEAASELSYSGLMIIEAPMGEGKTEAALVAAEILAAKSGRGGVFMALPTQATSDGMFGRIHGWINHLPQEESNSIFLAHGKSSLNDEYRGIMLRQVNVSPDEDETKNDNAVVNNWLRGRKKGILSNFVVGTVDQVLMGALRSKHLALRQLGLASKVVIIDECHAYDAYMGEYLYKILRWLGELKVPVIVLSATLPVQTRKRLAESYAGIKPNKSVSGGDVPGKPDKFDNPDTPDEWSVSRKYPLLTVVPNEPDKNESGNNEPDYNEGSDGDTIRSIPVPPGGRSSVIQFEILPDDEALLPRLTGLTSDGGCIGIIRNTVARAVETARMLQDQFEKSRVILIHSQLIGIDKIATENEIRSLLEPKGNRPDKGELVFIVGTQILEQSLDIDFDLVVSDICPMDLLIQRIGREHRHLRDYRPQKLSMPLCIVTGLTMNGEDVQFAEGSKYVYGDYHLYNTLAILQRNACKMNLPQDIPDFVQDAYAEDGVDVPEAWREKYETAKQADIDKIADKKVRANVFQIGEIAKGKRASLLDLFDNELAVNDDIRAEATVRDTNDSVEVMVVMRDADGAMRVPPWVDEYGGTEVPQDRVPDDGIARVIAACTITLPSKMMYPGKEIDRIIEELEESNDCIAAWQESYMLEGALFLILDEEGRASIHGFDIIYDRQYGLSAERIKKNDER